ncbi:hypothetical protein Acr_25g0001450 [Actinidia rufa]|uniref:Retrotransposon gag domain-containing protein n=1 Tax=Actinidia rufa TaxID=165716 RepID=A0A7J0GY57_9ERIC|nr:hypothetical protein Acr_25g0001450 [Actinidia rufa]
MRTRVSSRFKLPTQLRIYEGKTNPMNHQGYFGEVMCKAFSTTPIGSARSWFKKLTPGTIDTFGDLSRLFVANFAILEAEDPSDKVVIMAMMEGRCPGPLFDFLSKNVPETLSTLQSKADKYIAAKELAELNGEDEEEMIRGKNLRPGEQITEMKQGIKGLTEIRGDKSIIEECILVPHLAALNWCYHPSTPP